MRQFKDLQENFIAPNFLLLLLKAFLKEVRLDTMAHVYRMFIVNRFGPVSIAMLLSPTTVHDFSSMIEYPPPFYPGLIVRDLQGCYIRPSIIFEEN